MILGRIIRHLKEQNWTAIGLDLLIVIIGVFIGTEVANWNETRREHAGERLFLERLSGEMANDIREAGYRTVSLREIRAAGRRTERFLDADRSCSGDCWRVLMDFFVASQWTPVKPRRQVLATVQGSIYPYDYTLRQDLIRTYSAFHDGAELFAAPAYRTHLRAMVPSEVQDALWACNRGFGFGQTLDPDCPAAISDAEAGRIVDRLRHDPTLRDELTYYASTQTMIELSMGEWSAATKKLIDRVDAKLGGR